MYSFGNLDVTNVKWVLSFHPPSREDRNGAINLNFFFSVVKNLDLLIGWKPHWGRDLVIQVYEMLSLWVCFGEFCKNFFDQVVHCK